ncbi:MAG: GIY-YIG nuclease family protein [Atopobiaceae bacterium]|nr:GIY-YIG nuclease family protein [Atopobiaceae bacterium]
MSKRAPSDASTYTEALQDANSPQHAAPQRTAAPQHAAVPQHATAPQRTTASQHSDAPQRTTAPQLSNALYYIYIIRCEDNSLYTGITTDIVRRLSEHRSQSSRAARYTRTHKATELCGLWTAPNRASASKLEYRIKQLSRPEKDRLLEMPDAVGEPYRALPSVHFRHVWAQALMASGESVYVAARDDELTYLKEKDAQLAEVIKTLGPLKRQVDPNLFTSVVNSIVGQQISSKAHQTVWERLLNSCGEISPATLLSLGQDKLSSLGMSQRKASYILDFASKVDSGLFDLDAVSQMDDKEAIAALASLRGIGDWTAEMTLLFCLQRPNILSFGDFGIQKGMRMVYHHRKIDRARFDRYRRRLSPYCSVASLYFWAVANGAIPDMKDYAPKKKRP